MSPAADDALQAAKLQLEEVHRQADAVRSEMAAMRASIEQVQREFTDSRVARLMEANEQLVLAAMHGRLHADAAAATDHDTARMSQHDVLTGLANREVMADHLKLALAQAGRHGTRAALLFIDLDHFKAINDNCGHGVGDTVLHLVARRIESAVRESDTVSRHGGDEFLVLLPDITQRSDAALIASKIRKAIDTVLQVEAQGFHLSASIGIALYPDDGQDGSALIACADAAMYRAKRRPDGGVEFFSPAAAHDGDGPLPSPGVLRSAHPTRVTDLRQANEQMVLAAMKAQETIEGLLAAHRKRVGAITTIVHQLRHPLVPMRTAAATLMRFHAAESMVGWMGAVVDRQVTLVSRLVVELLEACRAQAGQVVVQPAAVELGAVLARAVEDRRPDFEIRLQHVVVALPEATLTVSGHPASLTHLFIQLLAVASRCTAVGGTISLTAVLGQAAVSVWLTVADDGPRGPVDKASPVFDMFVGQAEEPALHRAGPGMDRAALDQLVQAHGGSVVRSSHDDGSGNQYVVALPLWPGPQAP